MVLIPKRALGSGPASRPKEDFEGDAVALDFLRLANLSRFPMAILLLFELPPSEALDLFNLDMKD